MSGSDIEVDSDIEQEKQAIAQHNNNNDITATTSDTTATTNGTSSLTADGAQANQTLYINNLNDKIKLPEIKKGLYHVFGSHGNIVDVIVRPTLRCRGQAWVVYDSVQSAIAAVKATQQFLFFNKPLRVTYAKRKSDIVSKADGTFQPRPKRKHADDTLPEGTSQQQQAMEAKRLRALASQNDGVVVQTEPPNATLFIENLPSNTTAEQLNALFSQHTGFVRTRVIGSKNVAFVDFDNELQSTAALNTLQRHQMDDSHRIRITYAKR